MYSRLIAIACCLQIALSCVPVRPGEETVPCPAVPMANAADGYTTFPLEGPTKENTDTVFKCTAPSALLRVSPTLTSKLSDGAKLTCKVNSGEFVVQEDTEIPAGNDKFICGLGPCNLCREDIFIDETDAACSSMTTGTNILCSKKPTLTPDGNGCSKVSCTPPEGATEKLYLLIGNKAMAIEVNPDDVKCNGDKWLYTATDETPDDAIGFVCGNPALCNECRTEASMFYMNSINQVIKMKTEGPRPTCHFVCQDNYRLENNMMVHHSVYCDMTTLMVSLDNPNGAQLSAANKFDCAECMCRKDVLLGAGSATCPPNTLCTTPIVEQNLCTPICPEDTTVYYKKNGIPAGDGTAISCTQMNNWISDDADQDAGITCKYTDSTKGFTDVPPDVEKPCKPLTDMNPCPGTSCAFENIVYAKKDADGSYKAMCKDGSLATDKSKVGEVGLLTCTGDGTWKYGITDISMATCVTDDTAGIEDCTIQMTDATAMGNVVAMSSFGSTSFICKGMKMLQYEDDMGMPQTAAELKCAGGGVEGPFGILIIDPAKIKCV